MNTPLDEGTDRALRAIGAALVLFAAAVFGYVLVSVWPYTVDDAFIWFRYAENLSAGHGPTFNVEGPRAEGYTGFLWLWVMAIPHWLGMDPVRFAKLAGSALAVGTLLLTFGFAQRLSGFAAPGVRWIAAGAAVFILAASHTVQTHAISGMETILYTFLLQLLFCVDLAFHDAGSRRTLLWLPILALLVGLGRPEGNLAAGIVLGIALLRAPSDRRRRLLRNTLLFAVVPGAAYFAWRLTYYRVFLPLPFYITSSVGLGEPGVKEFGEFVRQIGITAGVLAAIGSLRCAGRIPGSLLAAVVLMLFFLFPSHRIPYHVRYFFPVLPLVCAVAGCGVATLLHGASSWISGGARRRSAMIACALALTAAIGLANLTNLRPDGVRKVAAFYGYYTRMLQSRHIALGKTLANVSRGLGRRPVLAIADAGAVPYYSKWHTIDSFGLNDAHIAVTGDHDPAYVLAQSPDLVILLSWRPKPFKPMFPWEGDLYEACQRAGMKVLRIYGSKPYALLVMGDPTSEIAKRLHR
jgi:hypothetical protein